MNVSNKLTILRILLIPVMIVLMYLPTPGCRYAALAVFCIASMTDFLDGYLARKNGWITDFGKFLDPLADKFLVLSALAVFCESHLVPAWFLLIILFRELSVDGLRLIAVTKGKVIAASKLGKIKTVSQILLIIWLFLSGHAVYTDLLSWILGLFVPLMTIISGADYFLKNRSALSEK